VSEHRTRTAMVRTMPPAGDRPAPGWRGRRSRLRVRSGVRGELSSRPPPTQAKPSRRGPWRPGRSYSGALHLDAMNHACSTVCGSTADGMRAGRVVGEEAVIRQSEPDDLRTKALDCTSHPRLSVVPATLIKIAPHLRDRSYNPTGGVCERERLGQTR
jgi:hypothetical protein